MDGTGVPPKKRAAKLPGSTSTTSAGSATPAPITPALALPSGAPSARDVCLDVPGSEAERYCLTPHGAVELGSHQLAIG